MAFHIDREQYARAELEDSTILVPRRLDLRRLYVELTSRCNLDCSHCFRREWRDEAAHMNPELWRSLMRQIEVFPQLELIHLAGVGEPTFSPLFAEALQAVKVRGIRLALTTNGVLFDESLAKHCVEEGLDEATVSLDLAGVCEGGLREGGSEGAFRALQLLHEAKRSAGARTPILRAAVVITRDNVHLLPSLPLRLRQVGCDRLMVSHLLPTSEEMVERTLYPLAEEEEKKLVRAVGVACRMYGISFELPRFRVETERRCAFVANGATFVRSDGAVAPCWRLLHNRSEWVLGRKKDITAHAFGHVGERALADIWTDDEYLFFRWRLRRALYASCLDCGLLKSCPWPDDTTGDCWGSTPACSDCLWDRNIILCP